MFVRPVKKAFHYGWNSVNQLSGQSRDAGRLFYIVIKFFFLKNIKYKKNKANLYSSIMGDRLASLRFFVIQLSD